MKRFNYHSKTKQINVFYCVNEALDDVHSQVLFMDQSCKGMSTKLTAVKTRTHQLMSQMTSFQTSRFVLVFFHFQVQSKYSLSL